MLLKYLQAVHFRLTDVLELHDLFRILTSALDKETAEYAPNMKLLHKSIRTKLQCSSDPPIFDLEANDDHAPLLQIARVSYQLAPQSIFSTTAVDTHS